LKQHPESGGWQPLSEACPELAVALLALRSFSEGGCLAEGTQ